MADAGDPTSLSARQTRNRGGDMNLVIQLIIGGIVGWLASIVMKTNAQMGMIANVVVGIVGAGLGGWLAAMLGIGGPPAMGWIMAVVGAAILIAVLKALGIFR